MSRLGKISLIFAALSLITFGIAKFMLSAWIPFFWILLGLVAFFLGAGIFVDRRFWATFFTLRTTKHGMNMGVLIVLTLSFIVILNYLAVKKNFTWDFSPTRANTLSDQSIQLLKSLDSELKVLFFYKNGVEGNDENRKAFREVIKKYQDQTDRIKLNFYEIDENPTLAEEYGVTKGSGVAFLDYKGKRNRIEKVDEQEITGALVKVTRERNKNVYLITGHGEFDLNEGREPKGMALYKFLLENNSFNVKTLNLPTQPQVPDDADVVAVIGPQQNFSEQEITAVKDYLKRGGQMFLALESGRTAGLAPFLQTMAILPQNNFIKSSFMGVGYVDGGAIGSEFSAQSTITKNFSGKQEIMRFGWPMDLKLGSAPEDITLTTLVATSSEASAFTKPEVSEGNFPTGPFNLIVEASGKYSGSEKDFTLVVAGDAEFLGNGMLYQNLNRDVGLGIISGLAKEEGLINITPREMAKTELKISTVNQGFLFFGVIVPVPLILLITSLVLWLKRRNA